jgi:3-dehydroquinate synthase
VTDIHFVPLAEVACKLRAFDDRFVLIYDEVVHEAVVPLIQQLNPLCIALAGGEEIKSRKMKEKIEDELLLAGFSADTMIIAAGGGSILDLAGFIAATFCRGVKLAFIPTTLLAMVDAAVGGKNGLNACGFKNMIGTVYHPHKLFIDYAFLKSLPKELFACGLVEMLKIGFLKSPQLVDGFDALISQDEAAVQDAIVKSISLKLEVIKNSSRDLLNFGHTFAHAIETLNHFQISHGKAVALGMQLESSLAKRLGILSESDYKKMNALIQKIPLCDYPIKKASQDVWLKALKQDKKSKKGAVGVVMLKAIGEPLGVQFVEDKQIVEVLDAAMCIDKT